MVVGVDVDVEDDELVVVVELVEDDTVCAQGATWEAVEIDGKEDDEEEEDGTLTVGVGAGAGAGAGLLVDGALVVDPLNGEGVGGGVVALAGGATCAPAFIVDVSRTSPATALRRIHRLCGANLESLAVIAGDP